MDNNTILHVINLYLKGDYQSPEVTIGINDQPGETRSINNDCIFTINVTNDQQFQKLWIKKTGKGIVSIVRVEIDNIAIPNYVVQRHNTFKFNDQVQNGCSEIHPEGKWEFTFEMPIFTWCLDQKILHESQYNKDYEFPWSFKLGPNSVETILQELDSTEILIAKTYNE